MALDDQRIAFALADVGEVLSAAEVTPLPDAPPVIRGLLKLPAEPLPVVDLRARVGLPERQAGVDDCVLSVLAEGVETKTQAVELRDLGAAPCQGFLYSEPIPPEQVHAFLTGTDTSQGDPVASA